MNETLIYILLFSLAAGVLSVFAAASYLLLPEGMRTRLLPHLVSFAIGAMLSAALLALIPHALNGGEGFRGLEAHDVGLTILIGLLVFFMLEKLVLWRHCHSAHCEAHAPHEAHDHGRKQSAAGVILFGDAMHNFVDGVLIAAAFITDFHLGVITAVAIASHEIPQEVGDFAILIHSGYSRMRALVFNILSSLATAFGGLVAWFSLQESQAAVPYVLAVAASSFLYVAVADLIPTLHHKTRLAESVQQVSLILLGVLVIFLAHSTLH